MAYTQRDTDRSRVAAVLNLRLAGKYIYSHAEDFVSRAGSDEMVLEDGFDLTVHVRIVDELPTITVRREVVLPHDGRDDG
jgi:hypothetical protein